MKERIYRWCGYSIAICTILILLITSIDMHAFNRSFYESEYSAMNTAEQLALSQADLMLATNTLLDYLQDKRDNVEVQIVESGKENKAFNERESLHMIDVKDLYQNALHARTIACVILLISISFLIYQKRRQALDYMAKGYLQIAVFFTLFIAFLGIWAITDFTSLWENFHHVFFRNDLWLLNPRTDLMINMFPEAFFFHMVIRITLTFVIGFILPLCLAIYYLNHKYHFFHLLKKEKTHA